MASTDYFSLDPTSPLLGSRLKSSELRRNLNAMATHLRSSTENSVPAQLAGDRRWATGGTRDLSTGKFLRITVNKSSSNSTTISFDVNCAGASPAATLLSEVVTKINTAFTTATGTGTIAFELDGFLLLKSPYKGSSSYLSVATYTNNADTPTNKYDGLDNILYLAKRESGPPFIYRGSDPVDGWLWNYTGTGSGATGVFQEIKYRNKNQARITGKKLGGGIDLPFNFLSFMMKAKDTNEVQVDVALPQGAGVSAALIAAEIQATAKTAFYNAGYTTYGTTGVFAAVVDTDRVQVKVPGPSSDPYGGTAYVKLLPAINDASAMIFGVETGLTNLDEYDRPLTGSNLTADHAANRDWAENATEWVTCLRDVDHWAGVGLYGPPVPSATALPSAGIADGEIRYARDTGIPWAWNVRRIGISPAAAWKRALPDGFRHIVYNEAREAYQLRTTKDYNPAPIVKAVGGAYDHYLSTANPDSQVVTGIQVSDIPELVDARDSRWISPQSGTTNTFSAKGSGARTISRYGDWKDDFRRSSTQPKLDVSPDGVAWTDGTVQGNTSGAYIANNRVEYSFNSSKADDGICAYLYDSAIPAGKMIVSAEIRTDRDLQAELYASAPQTIAGAGVLLGGVMTGSEVDYAIYVLVTANNKLDANTDPDAGRPFGKLMWGYVTGGSTNGGLSWNHVGSMEVEPLTASEGQVLRASIDGITNPTLKIWWRSSTDPTRWAQDEEPLVETTLTGTWGTRAGIIMASPVAADPNNPPFIYIPKFYAREGSTAALPGLPEVSGARLRDIITSVRVGTTFTLDAPGIVNDCTPEFPLELVAGDNITIEQNTSGRQFRFSSTATGGGGGGSGGGPGGSGGGTPPTLPPGWLGQGPGSGSYVTYDGQVTITGDRSLATLWNLNVGSTSPDADPYLAVSVIDTNWNVNALDQLNLRPADWATQSKRALITGMTTFNSAEYTRKGKTAPAVQTGVTYGGNDWSALTALTSVARMLAALCSNPNSTSSYLPSWLSSLSGTNLDPGAPYGANTPGPQAYIIRPDTAANLPLTGAGGAWNGVSPPLGVLAFDTTGRRIRYYNSSSNTWDVAAAQNTFSTVKVTAGGQTITNVSDTSSDTLTLNFVNGSNVTMTAASTVDDVVDITVNSSGGGGGATNYLDLATTQGTAFSAAGTSISNVGKLTFNDAAYVIRNDGTYSGDNDAAVTIDGPFKTNSGVAGATGTWLYPRLEAASSTIDFILGGKDWNACKLLFAKDGSKYQGTATTPGLVLRDNTRLILGSNSGGSQSGLASGWGRVLIQNTDTSGGLPKSSIALAPWADSADQFITFLRSSSNALSSQWELRAYGGASTSGKKNDFEFVDTTATSPTTILALRGSQSQVLPNSAEFMVNTKVSGTLTATSTLTGGSLVSTAGTIANSSGATKTIANLFDVLNNNADNILDGSTKVLMLATERTKLATIEECANVNPDITANGGAPPVTGLTLDSINFANSATVTWSVTGSAGAITISATAAGGGGGISTIKDGGVSIVNSATAIDFTNGIKVTASGSTGLVEVDLASGGGLKLSGVQLAADTGVLATQVATGTHDHATGSKVSWGGSASTGDVGVSNRTHALNSALHTGDLPAARVLNANAGQFTDATTYTVGKTSPAGVTLLLGHDGTNPLVSNTSRIFDHAHSGVGSGGKISYTDLNNIPTTFSPASHASNHAAGGVDAVPADSLFCSGPGVAAYTPTAGTVVGHLTGISNQLAAEAYEFLTVSAPSSLLAGEGSGAPAILLGTGVLGPVIANGKSKMLVELAVTFLGAVSTSSIVTVVAKNVTQNTSASVVVTAGNKYNTAAPNLVFASGDVLNVYAYTNGTASSALRCGTISLKFQTQP